MVDESKTNVIGGMVSIQKYAQVGAGCVIMPMLTIEEGVAVGAMSLVNENLKAWNIYAGIPARIIRKRGNNLLNRIDE
jgi:galactoside O-acetyltransferase